MTSNIVGKFEFTEMEMIDTVMLNGVKIKLPQPRVFMPGHYLVHRNFATDEFTFEQVSHNDSRLL